MKKLLFTLLLFPLFLSGCKNSELLEITLERSPDKTIYSEGETFDPLGMEIMAHYNDMTSKLVSDYTYSPTGSLTLEDKEIVITYSNLTTEVPITVNPKELPGEDYIESLEVISLPTKTTYYINEELDPKGCQIKVTRHQSGDTILELEKLNYSKLDSASVGQKEITVFYENWTVTFNVEVIEKAAQPLTIKEVKELIKSTQISTNSVGIGISDVKVEIVGLALERFDLVKTTSKFGLNISTPYKSLLVDETGYIVCASKDLFDKINDHAQKDTSTYKVAGYLSLYLNQPELYVTDFVWDKDLDVKYDLNELSITLTMEEYKNACIKTEYNCSGHGYGNIVSLKNLRCYYSDNSVSYFTDGKDAFKVVNKNQKFIVGTTYDLIGRISTNDYFPSLICYSCSRSDKDINEPGIEAYKNISVADLKKISYPQDDTLTRQEDYSAHCFNLYKTTGYISLVEENGKYYVGISDTYLGDTAISGKTTGFKSMALIDNNNFWNINETTLIKYNPYIYYVLEDIQITVYYSINQCDPTRNGTQYKIVLTPSLILETSI